MVLYGRRGTCLHWRMFHEVLKTFSFSIVALNQLHSVSYNNKYTNIFNFRIAQPLCLGYLIRYFKYPYDYEERDGYLFAAAVVAASGFYTFTHHPFFFGTMHVGMQIRIACCSLVYRKVRRFSFLLNNKMRIQTRSYNFWKFLFRLCVSVNRL